MSQHQTAGQCLKIAAGPMHHIGTQNVPLGAVICGANDFVAIARWARRKQNWLAKLLDMSSGVPSHDGFNLVLDALQAAEFERCPLRWILSLQQITDGQIVVIDGKTLRRS